jgi:hypothetical protein
MAMKRHALVLLFTSMLATSAPAALIPPCGEALPSLWSAEDHSEQSRSLGYLETMVRIELEGDALMARVSRGVAQLAPPEPECRSTAVPIIALWQQPD